MLLSLQLHTRPGWNGRSPRYLGKLREGTPTHRPCALANERSPTVTRPERRPSATAVLIVVLPRRSLTLFLISPTTFHHIQYPPHLRFINTQPHQLRPTQYIRARPSRLFAQRVLAPATRSAPQTARPFVSIIKETRSPLYLIYSHVAHPPLTQVSSPSNLSSTCLQTRWSRASTTSSRRPRLPAVAVAVADPVLDDLPPLPLL
jgi:hypothetical protein